MKVYRVFSKPEKQEDGEWAISCLIEDKLFFDSEEDAWKIFRESQDTFEPLQMKNIDD